MRIWIITSIIAVIIIGLVGGIVYYPNVGKECNADCSAARMTCSFKPDTCEGVEAIYDVCWQYYTCKKQGMRCVGEFVDPYTDCVDCFELSDSLQCYKQYACLDFEGGFLDNCQSCVDKCADFKCAKKCVGAMQREFEDDPNAYY